MATVFFSYNHKDEMLRDQLETHLVMLKRQGFIETWHDRRITAGESLDTAVSMNLERADVVLLLVSPDFLASDYCYDTEMKRALRRHEEGECKVIPIILRPCDWHDTPFGRLLAAPTDGKPITQWPDLDSAFLDVTQAIKRALAPRGATRGIGTGAGLAVAAAVASPKSQERSSNLRVAKRFSDHDKDEFQQQAFDFIARYFENSLSELCKRNPDIKAQFRPIDASRFTAVAYRDGQAVARCAVRLGQRMGMMSGITYSSDGDADSTSYNESLSVEADDQVLYLRPLGMSMMHRGGGNIVKLTFEGGAEFYWELFIERLRWR